MRLAILAGIVLLLHTLAVFAQDDPNAFGKVTITKADSAGKQGNVEIEGTVSANATYSRGGSMYVYAIRTTGGFIHETVVTVAMSMDETQPTTWTGTFPLPDGDFNLWALASITKAGSGQFVGSPLKPVSVANSVHTAKPNLVTVNFNPAPTRFELNNKVEAGGEFFVDKDKKQWRLLSAANSNPEQAPKLYAIPKTGGYVRTGFATLLTRSADDLANKRWGWGKNETSTTPTLDYNVILIVPIAPLSETVPPANEFRADNQQGSAWVSANKK